MAQGKRHNQPFTRSRRKSKLTGLGGAIQLALAWVGVLLLVEMIDYGVGGRLDGYGIFPRTLNGLVGVVFSPLLHADFAHLAANAGPMAMLLFILFSDDRYRPKSSLALLWLVSGLGTWLIGRQAIHIGASSLIYGLASFLIVASVWMKSWRALFFSIIVVTLFGGLFYGIFHVNSGVSWEGHLSGALAGVWVAWVMHGR
jgi:membrane associated rhomboid family serine protease